MDCNICNKNYGVIMIKIHDKNGIRYFCPNCITLESLSGTLNLVNDPHLKDDVTKEPGAVEFVTFGERYVLSAERMIRLINHHLKPEEWKILAEKYGSDKYELHDDFYDERGIALQPSDE